MRTGLTRLTGAIFVAAIAGCSLNPQPLPPDTAEDAGAFGADLPGSSGKNPTGGNTAVRNGVDAGAAHGKSATPTTSTSGSSSGQGVGGSPSSTNGESGGLSSTESTDTTTNAVDGGTATSVTTGSGTDTTSGSSTTFTDFDGGSPDDAEVEASTLDGSYDGSFDASLDGSITDDAAWDARRSPHDAR